MKHQRVDPQWCGPSVVWTLCTGGVDPLHWWCGPSALAVWTLCTGGVDPLHWRCGPSALAVWTLCTIESYSDSTVSRKLYQLSSMLETNCAPVARTSHKESCDCLYAFAASAANNTQAAKYECYSSVLQLVV